MAQLPVYVINLDRRPDRWAAMSAQLDRLGIEATRIPAVDARLLAAQERWEMETNGNPPFWRINLGAAAGMLSTSKAMIGLLGSDAPAALILEDDAELAPDTPSLLGGTGWWPAGAHIVRLEAGGDKSRPLRQPSGRTPTGRMLHRLERWNSGAAAYLIDRRGARIALEAFANPSSTTDQTLFDLRYSKAARKFGTVQIVPAMARQRAGDGTDQQRWRDKRKAEMPGWRRRAYWVRRSLGGLPYKMRVMVLRAFGQVRNRPVLYDETPGDRQPK